jgi:hypothetical protein
MDTGDIQPREVVDVQDDKDQVLPPPNVQASTSGSHDHDKVHEVQNQQEVSSSQSNQASDQSQVLQPVSIARDHTLDQIVEDIRSDVQTRLRLASFYEHYSFVSSFEPTKIEDALMDVDWANVMYEELNNFTYNQVWELVERPKNYNVIGTKWVFQNKQGQDGIVVRNKARFEGLEFGETYTPVKIGSN